MRKTHPLKTSATPINPATASPMAKRPSEDLRRRVLADLATLRVPSACATATSWSVGRRAPLLNEDAQTVTTPPQRTSPAIGTMPRAQAREDLSPHGRPFPLHGIRILDFTWFLASAGGTRFLSAFGAIS